MSQYSWFFVNKNYLLFTILATVLVIPVGFVTADIVFSPEVTDTELDDGASSTSHMSGGTFTGLNGPSGVATFMNGTDNFVVVAAFDDDAVTLIDISNPQNIFVQDTLDGSNDGTGTNEGRLVLEGASNIELFSNGTNDNYAIVTAFIDDGVQIIHLADSKSDTAHSMYAATNITSTGFLGTGAGPVLHGLNGATDVAVFSNTSGPMDNKYALVTGHQGNSIQLLDISDPENGGKIYPNGHLSSVANATAAPSATLNTGGGYGVLGKNVGNYGGAIPIKGAFGVDIFYSSSDGNMPYAIVTGQISDGFQIFSLNDTAKGLVPYANKTSADTGFELLNSPVGVATWNTTNHDKDRWAIIASNATDSVTVINLYDPGAVTVTDTMEQTSNLSLDGALHVEVAKVGDRHYAFIASNGTGAGTDWDDDTLTQRGGFQVIDLYQPTQLQPVASTYDGVGDFGKLAGARGITTFILDGHTYAAITGYTDDGIHIVKITKDKTSGGSNAVCGITADCAAPTISSNGGSISVNGNNLVTADRFNDSDKLDAKVGQMVTVKAKIYDSFGANAVWKSNLYFDMHGVAPEWTDAEAAIRYDILRNEIEIIDNNDIFDANASHTTSGDYVEVTFSIMFTGEMDSSHMAIQNIDNSRNYQLKYFRDALEVTGTPTQTSLTATDDEITQTATASVPAWVKNTAGWWAEGAISEGEFVKGVEYLIQQQIIDTDAQTTSSDGTGAAIPDWVKNTAGWWADGSISEGEFVNAIEHLVKTGTIIII